MRVVLTRLAAVALTAAASAAAPVEEARVTERVGPVAASTADARPAGQGAADDGGVGTLYYQLQVLQDDVRRLQGIVEEQNYRIDRLVREQRQRYIELDQRLVALRPDAAADAVDGSGGIAAPGEASAQGDAYNRAFAIVTAARQLPQSERAQEYERALGLFDALIAEHPNSQFTPNAYYWIGELNLATDKLELARQAFVQVANLYGDHAKAPGALYKLGVTYHRLGDNAQALEYLDRVMADHPDDTAAGLARSYAAELR